MSWKKLYTPIDKRECIGWSMEKINKNFFDIDTYISTIDTSFVFDGALKKAENLADVTDIQIARNNLGLGTAVTKNKKLGAQAWVVFNPSGTIINQFNVSSVVRRENTSGGFGIAHGWCMYEITYTTPLEYVGPIMVSGDCVNDTGRRVVRDGVVSFDSNISFNGGFQSFPPSVTRCGIFAHDIDIYQHQSHWHERGQAINLNVVIF